MLKHYKLWELVLIVVFITSTLISFADELEGKEIASEIYTVKNMTCVTCPITVRKSILRVDGVHSVEVDFVTKTATVTYDPSVASATEIGDASTSVGFPATRITEVSP